MQHLNIHKAHAIIGVSQGGAAALAFGTHFSDKTNIIIACDTGPRTAPGNKEAWAERIELARSKGLNALADVTVPRWFPVGSPCHLNSDLLRERGQWIHDMISRMSLDGFACGAAALQDYDLLDAGKEQNEGKSLLECRVKTLLVAGSLDGGGNVPKGMRTLKDKWSEAGGTVEFVEIEGAGHLPMVDQVDEFVRTVKQFLEKPK
jgi:pimeloyl-ACP methyl ester carboxylesterase